MTQSIGASCGLILALIALAIDATAGGYTFQQRITSPAAVGGDHRFGFSVAAAGEYVFVGASEEDSIIPPADEAGSVSVYTLNGTSSRNLEFVQQLWAPSPQFEAEFGASVAAHGDLVAVGSPKATVEDNQVGAVFLFQRAAGSDLYTFVEMATAPVPQTQSRFASSVDVSASRLVVGAELHGNGSERGEAYAFDLDPAASPGQVATNATALPIPGLDGNHIGSAIATDLDYVVVGAEFANGGEVHLLAPNATGHLHPTDRVTAASPSDSLGTSVSMFQLNVVVGSSQGDTSDTGYAVVYRINTSTHALEDPQPLVPPLNGPGGIQFGSSVVIHAGLVAVGAPQWQGMSGSNPGSGAVFVFALDLATGVFEYVTRPPTPTDEINRLVGASVAVLGSTVIAGAPSEDDGTFLDAGAVFTFADDTANSVLVVNEDFCNAYGGAFSVACIEIAIGLANVNPTYEMVLFEPGLYTGCTASGVGISRDNLVVSTTDYPNLPSAASAGMEWTCGSDSNARHLLIDEASNVTIAGIAFVGSVTATKRGVAAKVDTSVNVVFEACAFENLVSDRSIAGGLLVEYSDVSVRNSVADRVRLTATGGASGAGGFLHAVYSNVALVNTTVANSAAVFGGAISLSHSSLSAFNATLRDCSATMGGGVFASASNYNISIAGISIASSTATVSGGGIYVSIGRPGFEPTISDVTVDGCSAANGVGGGITAAASDLQTSPGTRRIAVTRSTLSGNLARLGGGLFSEVDTSVVNTTFLSNSAVGNGGGAAFRPSPCLESTVSVFNSDFSGNSASLVGGGLYTLSSGLDVELSRFRSNDAKAGGAMGMECAAEVCTNQPRRDTCNSLEASVSAGWFVGNTGSTGGAVYVENQAVAIATNGSVFDANQAYVGAAVYADPSARVLVNGGVSDSVANAVLTTLAEVNNTVLDGGYGPAIASVSTAISWGVTPPKSGRQMAGTNRCDYGDDRGCVVSIYDRFGNSVIPPVVVQLSIDGLTAQIGSAPRFLLVDGGSTSIPELSIRPRGLPDMLNVTDSSLDVQFVGSADVGQRVEVTSTPCGPGWGAVHAAGFSWCEPCPVNTYSSAESWEVCSSCNNGTATNVTGSRACDLCARGYGLADPDDAESGCALCPVGTFASGANRAACESCQEGLTTDAAGAVGCTQAINTAGESSPGFDVLVVIVTVVILLVGIVALIVSCLRKRDARHAAIGTVLLSLYDVITDYLFLFALVNDNADKVGGPDDHTTLIVVSVGSVAAAFLINLLLTAFVLLRERRRPAFAKWMRQNVAAVAVTAVLSTTNVSVLAVLKSGVFGVDATQAPLSRDTADLIEFGGVASVLFEDAPQLVVACVYLASDPPDQIAVVLLTILASAASVLTGLFLRLVLCCVLDVDAGDGDGDGDDDGVEMGSVNPVFGEPSE